jgi:hypothetical protein
MTVIVGKSPYVGRVRLRPNRGFRMALVCDVTPHKSAVRVDHQPDGRGIGIRQKGSVSNS